MPAHPRELDKIDRKILRVLQQDARIYEMASYRKLLGNTLLTMPHVRDSKSYIVMEEVKETLNLPVSG